MAQQVTEEKLMAFDDRGTDEATAEMDSRALQHHAGLAARARGCRGSRKPVREAFRTARSEPVPEALFEAVRRADQPDNVVAFPTRRTIRFALPLAASLAVAFGYAG